MVKYTLWQLIVIGSCSFILGFALCAHMFNRQDREDEEWLAAQLGPDLDEDES